MNTEKVITMNTEKDDINFPCGTKNSVEEEIAIKSVQAAPSYARFRKEHEPEICFDDLCIIALEIDKTIRKLHPDKKTDEEFILRIAGSVVWELCSVTKMNIEHVYLRLWGNENKKHIQLASYMLSKLFIIYNRLKSLRICLTFELSNINYDLSTVKYIKLLTASIEHFDKPIKTHPKLRISKIHLKIDLCLKRVRHSNLVNLLKDRVLTEFTLYTSVVDCTTLAKQNYFNIPKRIHKIVDSNIYLPTILNQRINDKTLINKQIQQIKELQPHTFIVEHYIPHDIPNIIQQLTNLRKIRFVIRHEENLNKIKKYIETLMETDNKINVYEFKLILQSFAPEKYIIEYIADVLYPIIIRSDYVFKFSGIKPTEEGPRKYKYNIFDYINRGCGYDYADEMDKFFKSRRINYTTLKEMIIKKFKLNNDLEMYNYSEIKIPKWFPKVYYTLDYKYVPP